MHVTLKLDDILSINSFSGFLNCHKCRIFLKENNQFISQCNDDCIGMKATHYKYGEKSKYTNNVIGNCTIYLHSYNALHNMHTRMCNFVIFNGKYKLYSESYFLLRRSNERKLI